MRRAIAAVISVVVMSGCGGGGGAGGTGGSSGRACVPGMSIACACTNGTRVRRSEPAVAPATAPAYEAAGQGATGAMGNAGTTGAGGAARLDHGRAAPAGRCRGDWRRDHRQRVV